MLKNNFSKIMVVLVFSAITSLGFCQSEQNILPKEEYIREDFIFIPWGEGEGQIKKQMVKYRDKLETTENITKMKYEIDETGNIYVYDASYGKPDDRWTDTISQDKKVIYKYNPQGKLTKSYSHFGYGVKELKIDRKNQKFYILDGAPFSIKLNKIKKYDEIKGKSSDAKGMPLQPLVEQKKTPPLEISVINYWRTGTEEHRRSPEGGPSIVYEEDKKTPSAIKIKGLNNSLNEVIIGPFNELITGAKLLGIDENNNIYLVVGIYNTKDHRFSFFWIYKISSDGKLLAKIELKSSDGRTIAYQFVKFYKSYIYAQGKESDGIYIYRWRLNEK